MLYNSIELIQCYFWNITWMDGVLLQALKIRNKPFAGNTFNRVIQTVNLDFGRL